MKYPRIVTQAWLRNQLQPEETRLVRLELVGCYNTRPVPVYGKTNNRYLFPYDSRKSCHALEVPESIWMADGGKFARDLMLQPMNRNTIVALILPISKPEPVKKAAPLPKATKAPKPKTAEDAAMAVLGG